MSAFKRGNTIRQTGTKSQVPTRQGGSIRSEVGFRASRSSMKSARDSSNTIISRYSQNTMGDRHSVNSSTSRVSQASLGRGRFAKKGWAQSSFGKGTCKDSKKLKSKSKSCTNSNRNFASTHHSCINFFFTRIRFCYTFQN